MIYLAWTVGLILVLFVIVGVYDHKKQMRAQKLLPQLLTDDWIKGRDLRRLLAKRGVSLSYGSFYVMMSRQGDIVEWEDHTEVIDGERLKIRHFRRRFAPSPEGSKRALNTIGQ